MIQYIFPFGKIPKNSNIILYGAGDVGKTFYQQIIRTGYCKIVLWVDGDHLKFKKLGYSIAPPEKMVTINFDYVVIAVRESRIAMEIINHLNTLGLDRNRYIWSEEYAFESYSAYKTYKQEFKAISESDVLKKIEPQALLSSKRLDIIVRYLLCRDILNHVDNKRHLDLYAKFILQENGGEEPIQPGTISEYFADYKEKKSIPAFLQSFRELAFSMQKNGFLKTDFIAVDTGNKPINASHRLAAALALEEKVWAKWYEEFGNRPNVWEFKWFEEHGFTVCDKIAILRGFADLYENSRLILLLAPCWDNWDYLESRISSTVNIVGQVSLNFQSDYLGFENIIQELYRQQPYQRQKEIFHTLLLAPLKMKVLLVSDEKKGCDNFEVMIESLSKKLRLFLDTAYEAFDPLALVYIVKEKDNFIYAKNTILSENNLKYNSMRLGHKYEKGIQARLNNLKGYLQIRNIPLCDVCIIGDSVLEVFGMRESEKLEFIFLEKYEEERVELFGQLPKDIEAAYKNILKLSDDLLYKNDTVIRDHFFFFIYDNMKFLNPDILMEMKKYHGGEEDLFDVRLIELMFEYARYFDDKRIVKEQFEWEMARQGRKFYLEGK